MGTNSEYAKGSPNISHDMTQMVTYLAKDCIVPRRSHDHATTKHPFEGKRKDKPSYQPGCPDVFFGRCGRGRQSRGEGGAGYLPILRCRRVLESGGIPAVGSHLVDGATGERLSEQVDVVIVPKTTGL